ncbi:hypothetical protein BB561_002619 [Smittium simulii]|uniref:Prefoldin subunit 6 n=1 Tax=Smittium simulii TaxID=133385 RepID=A0A2T9YPR4_9FUNG|nr:hypothetical protein BB561_002619 [Smittium simulii]
MSLEKNLEKESLEMRKLQSEYSKLIETSQQLSSQLQENELVQKEFSLVGSDAKIYKMIGPVLVPQDKEEAGLNVEKRIEYIKAELTRVEARIKELATLQEKKSLEIYNLQMKFKEQATISK